MIEIGVIIVVVIAIAGWIKNRTKFPNHMIPAVVVILSVAANLINAWLFTGDYLEAGRNAFMCAIGAIGIHSGVKNSLGK